MLSQNLNLSPALEELALEKCPEAVQVMPVTNSNKPSHIALAIFGNVVLGLAFLSALMVLPALIAGYMPVPG